MGSTRLDMTADALRLLASTTAGPLPAEHESWRFELLLSFGCRVDLGAVKARFSKKKSTLTVRAPVLL